LRQLQRFVMEHYRQPIIVKRADHLLADSDRPPDHFATDFSVYQMASKTDATDSATGLQTAARAHASGAALPLAERPPQEPSLKEPRTPTNCINDTKSCAEKGFAHTVESHVGKDLRR